MDYRPVWSYKDRPDEVPLELRGPGGRSLPHQVVATEHSSFAALPWRKRVAFQADLPPMGWQVYTLGWVEGARQPRAAGVPARSGRPGGIDNGILSVSARRGGRGVMIRAGRAALLSGPGLQAVTVEDPLGSWGDMTERAECMNLSAVRHAWRVERVEAIETGPERAALAVRLAGGASSLDLVFRLWRGRSAVDVEARLLWNERAARLKLVLPGCDRAVFEVPGGCVSRRSLGEVPGGRWVEARRAGGGFGFASDALYCFDCTGDALRATLVRSTRYADDAEIGGGDEPFRPATDQGEHRFRFLLAPRGAPLAALAEELERPPVAVLSAPCAGPLGRSGSLMTIVPESARVLALKPAAEGSGFMLRVQLQAARPARGSLTWLGARVDLGILQPWAIATFRLEPRARTWRARPVDATERPAAAR